MIAGEDQDIDAVEARRRAALPKGKPSHHVLEAAKAARRLGQQSLPARDPLGSVRMRMRQIEASVPQFGNGSKAGHGQPLSCQGAKWMRDGTADDRFRHSLTRGGWVTIRTT